MATKTPEQVDAWLKALEAERYDTTYLGRTPASAELTALQAQNAKLLAELKEKPKPATASQRKRDAVMFHAGRYAAGVRDDEATNAFHRMESMIKGGK